MQNSSLSKHTSCRPVSSQEPVINKLRRSGRTFQLVLAALAVILAVCAQSASKLSRISQTNLSLITHINSNQELTVTSSPIPVSICRSRLFRTDTDQLLLLDQSQLYQNAFNFTGPVCITHELHETNSQAYIGVDTTADVSTELRIFFPSMTDDVIDELLALYPEDHYTSPGLCFADMRQSFGLTSKNLALTQALNNQTWNGRVDLGEATHATDQSYYWYSTYTLSSTTTTTTTTTSNSSSTSSVVTSASSTASNSTSSDSITTRTGPGGAGGGMGSTSVNSTVAVSLPPLSLMPGTQSLT